MIYLVVHIGGKQYTLSTHLRVYPNQWNQEKQLAVISNVQSKLDNHNNEIVNEQINKLRHYYSEFFEYICNNYVTDVFETLKRFIYRDVAKNKFVLLYVLAEALEYYHNYVKPSVKESTIRQNESLLSEFGRFPFIACSWGFVPREQLVAAGISAIVDKPEEIEKILSKE